MDNVENVKFTNRTRPPAIGQIGNPPLIWLLPISVYLRFVLENTVDVAKNIMIFGTSKTFINPNRGGLNQPAPSTAPQNNVKNQIFFCFSESS